MQTRKVRRGVLGKNCLVEPHMAHLQINAHFYCDYKKYTEDFYTYVSFTVPLLPTPSPPKKGYGKDFIPLLQMLPDALTNGKLGSL
jgi:hypothetical protein